MGYSRSSWTCVSQRALVIAISYGVLALIAEGTVLYGQYRVSRPRRKGLGRKIFAHHNVTRYQANWYVVTNHWFVGWRHY